MTEPKNGNKLKIQKDNLSYKAIVEKAISRRNKEHKSQFKKHVNKYIQLRRDRLNEEIWDISADLEQISKDHSGIKRLIQSNIGLQFLAAGKFAKLDRLIRTLTLLKEAKRKLFPIPELCKRSTKIEIDIVRLKLELRDNHRKYAKWIDDKKVYCRVLHHKNNYSCILCQKCVGT